ncbi:N-acetyltransferase [Schizosaccharomyces japonicus yFS275]|uniref:N-acetyltransferase n=1 Tax=Schizosaccharomyces japonicus (strain yFS275 / FY16936) TaxID=402676 RepID=B6K3X2_SCHJY|nr:N-acetyltransferase [Schizosaccharomyces japonicus yFS275]EEB08179.2 N-acetyltransferase [Schizosaccharomyces japonicus yFS275]
MTKEMLVQTKKGEKLRIRRMRFMDLVGVSNTVYDAFKNSKTWHWRFGGCSDRVSRILTVYLTLDSYVDPLKDMFVASTTTNKYAGMLAYKYVTPKQTPKPWWRQLIVWATMLLGALMFWILGAQQVRRRFEYNGVEYRKALVETGLLEKPNGYVHVDLLAVHVDEQHKGIAGILMDIAHDCARKHNVPSFLMASQAGFDMYVHMGYKHVSTAVLIDERTGDVVRNSPAMIWEPKDHPAVSK